MLDKIITGALLGLGADAIIGDDSIVDGGVIGAALGAVVGIITDDD